MLPQPQGAYVSTRGSFGRHPGEDRPPTAAKPGGRPSKPDLDQCRRALLQSREKLLDELSRIESAIHENNGDHVIDFSTTSQDTAGRTRAWQHVLALGDVDNKRCFLREIDAALERLTRGDFGRCVIDGSLIPREKLLDTPWVSRCDHCILQ